MNTRQVGESRLDQDYYKDWHLGHTPHEAMTTEFEWAVLRFEQAFQRFILQVGSMSGLGHLTYQELISLHVIRMQDRPKTATVIARQLNMDGITNLQYSLRKLIKYKLLTKIKGGNSKIYTYAVTPAGVAMLEEYTRIRRNVLTDQTMNIEQIDKRLIETAKLISMLTGVYDEAGRVSATYSTYSKLNLVPESPKKSKSEGK
jgi:predicted MarR family transcription regulator